MKIRSFVVVGLVAVLGATGVASAAFGEGISDVVRTSKGGLRGSVVERQIETVTDAREVSSKSAAVSCDFVGFVNGDAINGAYSGGTSANGVAKANLGLQFNGATALATYNGCCSPSAGIAYAPAGSMLISSTSGTQWNYVEFYVSSTVPLTVQTFASTDGTGTALQTINLGANITNAPYSTWSLRQLTLTAAASSIRISGTSNRWGIDNVATSRAPTLASISPASGSQFGGTAVTLTGSGFAGASAVRIGGEAVSSFSVVSDSQINAVTAFSATSGPRDVAVTTPLGNAVLAGGFTYVAATPTLVLSTDAATCNPIGSTVNVAATLSGVATQVVAGQISIVWNPAKLSIQSISAGDAPFTQVNTINAAAGTATILVSVAPGSSGAIVQSAVMARIRYSVIGGSCDGTGTSVDFNPVGNLATQFTNGYGSSIRPGLTGSTGFKVDDGAPVLSNVPANVVTQAQAGEGNYASVTLGTPTATDACAPGLVATGTRSDSRPLSAKWPVGTTTVTWSATDPCGNTTLAYTTVTVQPYNTMQFTVNWVSPFGGGAGATRTVSMSFTGASGTVTRSQAVTVAGNGQATFSVTDLPVDTYTCVMVEDAVSSLKRRLTVSDSGDNWTAATGTLVLGDVIHDGVVDVLDWGAYVVLNPNADLNADGFVNATDGNIILANFGKVSDSGCNPSFGGPREPVTAITVADVVAMGLPELAGADLNADGWIDQTDIDLFMN